MKVHEINITKRQVDHLNNNEKTILIQFGHVTNELSFLRKLLLFVMDPEKEKNEITKSVMFAQSMMLARLFIGKLHESWMMLNKNFFNSKKLSQEINSYLPDDAKIFLKNLKQYFSKINIITTIRNEYSFHYTSDHMNDILKPFDDDKKFKIIIGPDYSNTIILLSEELITKSMISKNGNNDTKEAMNIFFTELLEVSDNMIQFLSISLSIFINLRFGNANNSDYECILHDIDAKEKLQSFKIPFFVS